MTVPAQKKTSPLVVVLLVLAAGLGGLTLLFGGAYLLFFHELEKPLTDADRDLLITAEHIVALMEDVEVKPAVGVTKKVGHFDGSVELDYEYDASSDPDHPIYVTTHLAYEKKPSDARNVYNGFDLGMALGTRLSGEGKLSRKDCAFALKLGDESKCKQLLYEDKPVGVEVHVLAGTRVLFFNATGAVFNDPEPLRELLEPRVQKARLWKP
jgi:hypothetical protein